MLNFDLDLKFRDERCALVYMLRMVAVGKLYLTEFWYTSRVQLKREEFGNLTPWGDSLTGVRSNFILETERAAACADLGVGADLLTVIFPSLSCDTDFDFCSVEPSRACSKARPGAAAV
jgi:hypothetical protein